MKKWVLIHLLLASLLAACRPSAIPTQVPLSTTREAPSATHSSSSTYTPLPSRTPIYTPLLASTPSPSPSFAPSPPIIPLTALPSSEQEITLNPVAQLGGSLNGITIMGDVAYVGVGPRVAAIDISQHDNPRLVGESSPLPGQVTHLLLFSSGTSPSLVVNAGKYLVLLDISDPAQPVPVHQLELAGAVTAMALDPNSGTIYAGGSIYQAPYEYSGFVVAVSITPEDDPSMLSSVDLPDQPLSLAVGEQIIYVGLESDNHGLYTVRLDSSGVFSQPREVISTPSANYFEPYSMQVIGERLYIGNYMQMEAYDITDPGQPVQAWTKNVGLMVEGFSLQGDRVDVFGWAPAGTYLPGVATLSLPQPMAGSPLGEIASVVARHRGDFLVAYRDLEIYVYAGPQDLSLVGSYQPPVITVLGAASDEHAVYLVDAGVENGRNPAILRVFSLPELQPLGQVATDIPTSWGWFSGIAVEGDRAYLAAKDGLWAYDLSSPSPTLLNKLDIIDGQLNAITTTKLGDRRILILSQDSSDLSALTLTAYDLTDIQKPIRMSSPLTLERGTILQMAWNGSTLYAVRTAIYESDSDLLYLVNFDGDVLVLRGKLPLPGYIFSMAVENGLVALAGTDGLTLVSAADAQYPRILSEATLPELGLGVAILRDTALVIAGGNNGAAQLLTFDIQGPANPRHVKSVDIAFGNSLIGPIPAVKPYIILANGSAGLEVLETLVFSTCLDTQAKPQTVPPLEQPLEVRFLSDGNIWIWEEGISARQISDTSDALRFTFSPDGEVIAFERLVGDYPWGQFKIELWAIDREGNNLRQLVSAEQFDQFLPGREEAWVANVPTDYRWFASKHELTFGVYPYINAVGAGQAAEGYWIVDTDTLELKKWADPQVIDFYGPKEISSPDGKLIARVDRESISLLSAGGSVMRKDALTYQPNNNAEGPGWGAPKVVWSSDSLTLKVLVWDEDAFGESFSTWEIPANGSPIRKLHTFSGIEFYSFIAPNQEYIAYLKRVKPMSNEHELHLAKFDGSADVIYATGYQLFFQGWAPDSFHFAYDLFATHRPQLGSLCGDPVPLVGKNDTPATQITWVDGDRFLFAVGEAGNPRELRLGQVGSESLLLGPFKGERAYYEVKQERQDLIVP